MQKQSRNGFPSGRGIADRGTAVSRRRSSRVGWTPALRALFLERLAAWGNVRAAAASCGFSRQSIYKLRRRDPLFAREWDAALARLDAALEQELMRWMTGNPRLAALWQALAGPDGQEIAPLDAVNSINQVSTAPAQRTHSSPISS